MKFFGILLAFIFSFPDAGAQSAKHANNNVKTSYVNSQSRTLITCNNWLRTQAVGQSVKIGDLDVIGNTITVEAQYNRVLPAANSYILEDIVSKHGDPA